MYHTLNALYRRYTSCRCILTPEHGLYQTLGALYRCHAWCGSVLSLVHDMYHTLNDLYRRYTWCRCILALAHGMYQTFDALYRWYRWCRGILSLVHVLYQTLDGLLARYTWCRCLICPVHGLYQLYFLRHKTCWRKDAIERFLFRERLVHLAGLNYQREKNNTVTPMTPNPVTSDIYISRYPFRWTASLWKNWILFFSELV